MTANKMPAAPDVSRESSGDARVTQNWGVFATWLMTRAIILYLAISPERHADSDIRHYWKQMAPMFHGASVRGVLVEYPLPVLTFLWPLDRLADGHPRIFNILFASAMLGVDALFTVFLTCQANEQKTAAAGAWFWVLFGLSIGPILIFRFDVLCGALAALTLTYLVTRPRRAGAALAVAVATKLWPAALLPLVLIPREGRRKIFLSAATVGGFLLLACVALGGIKRTLSPLTWQNARGLQIESVFASVAVIQRMHDPQRWKATFHFGAVQIVGPGVNLAEKASSVTLLVSVLGIGAFVFWYHRSLSVMTVSWLYLLGIALLIVTNKTYSAQYIIWLAAPCAVFLSRIKDRTDQAQICGLVVLIAVLTQLEYPVLYRHLWPEPTSWDVVFVLVIRNILVLALTGFLAYQCLGSARRDHRADRTTRTKASTGAIRG